MRVSEELIKIIKGEFRADDRTEIPSMEERSASRTEEEPFRSKPWRSWTVAGRAGEGRKGAEANQEEASFLRHSSSEQEQEDA